jgi:MFS family permease
VFSPLTIFTTTIPKQTSINTNVGVVAAAPSDWTHSELLPVFSCAAVVLGVTTSALGEWVEKSGPRLSGMVGSAFWSGALLTTALGIETHTLPLVYLGYGVLGGVGWGLMYLTPVTSAMKWFPDRRGLATGIALSAFGAGAAFAPSVIHALVDHFSVAPEFIGDCLLTSGGIDIEGATKPLVELATLEDGSQVVANTSPVGQPGTPVVVATEADVAKSSGITTCPGVYAVGTGDTGISKAMASLGGVYGVLGTVASRFMKIPHPEWTPTVGEEKADAKISETNNIGLPASYVTTNTKQFTLLWLAVFGNATGGLALLSSSKVMLTDIFAGVAPHIVTPAFSTGYVSALGVGMALGRFGWSAISDVLGRQNTYALFGLGIPIVGLTPYLCHAVVDMASGAGAGGEIDIWPLMAFYSGSVLTITFYGGVFSVLPAYIADLFGQKHAGAIHGKALTAWATSAVAGPMGLAYLRSHAYQNAIEDLLQTIEGHDAPAFERSFGVSINDDAGIQNMVNAKTLTIEKLMELAPPGTVDPTPYLYNTTLYVAAVSYSLYCSCHCFSQILTILFAPGTNECCVSEQPRDSTII